ncbi:MAG TPA: L-seryl-tRNA(Sec) selenium transferase [Anaerolineae bacterium]|nr:L-seryl-tRNA(Sec) selenium transferase [Anaerolineae bacterium]
MSHSELRKLPSVDRLLQQNAVVEARPQFGHDLTVETARTLLDETRAAIVDRGQPCPDLAELAAALLARLHAATQPTLQPIINATGVIIHTNLGRAPLSDDALAAMRLAGEGYSNLEYDLEAGQRGSRYVHAVDLLRRLTGAEDALVVNNNAAAVLLCLMALARDRQVIISRGQLVEIGGGFRIPDVLQTSGAVLVEVGTTNRTHLRDYQDAIGPDTAALLRVHSSNFRQIGFTAEVSLAELVALGQQHNLPVIDDLGSGTLLDTSRFGLAYEPRVQDSVQAGATLVTFSGDKLLGGPQAGLIVGQCEAIARLRQHPLTRAMRVDKTTLAGLAATLGHYLRGQAEQIVPVWRMIAAQEGELADRAAGWAARLADVGLEACVVAGASTVGGGSLPGETLPTRLLALPGLPADRLAARLRAGQPAMVARIVDDALCFDPRTVLPEQDELLLSAILVARQALT